MLGGLDVVVSERVAAFEPWTRHVGDVVSDVLVYGVAALFCLAATAEAIRDRDVGRGAGIALLLLAVAATNTILKPAFARDRPRTAYSETFAFPSGHTSSALLVTSAILLTRITPARLAAVASVASATAIARVLSGAHWVSDVLGGLAYGTLVVALLVSNERIEGPRSGSHPAT